MKQTVRYAREDLRRNTKVVLGEADAGRIVEVGSRFSSQDVLHILNNQRLMELRAAEEELESRRAAEASTAKGRLGERLQQAVRLLDEVQKRPWACDPTSPEGIAEILGLESTTAFEDLMQGRASARFETLRAFARRYGFGERWLIDGTGEIFPSGQGQSHLQGIWEEAYRIGRYHGYDPHAQGKIHLHFLLFERGPLWHIGLLAGNGAFGWHKLDTTWHLSETAVGGSTGHDQLHFYRVLRVLRRQGYWFDVSSSRSGREEDFEDFYRHRRHPAYFVHCLQKDGWTDDFRDEVEGIEVSRPYRKEHYGKHFFQTAEGVWQQLLQAGEGDYTGGLLKTLEAPGWMPEGYRKEFQPKNATETVKNLPVHRRVFPPRKRGTPRILKQKG